MHVFAFAGVAAGAVTLARFAPGPEDSDSPDARRLRYLVVAHSIVVAGAVLDTVMWQLDLPRIDHAELGTL